MKNFSIKSPQLILLIISLIIVISFISIYSQIPSSPLYNDPNSDAFILRDNVAPNGARFPISRPTTLPILPGSKFLAPPPRPPFDSRRPTYKPIPQVNYYDAMLKAITGWGKVGSALSFVQPIQTNTSQPDVDLLQYWNGQLVNIFDGYKIFITYTGLENEHDNGQTKLRYLPGTNKTSIDYAMIMLQQDKVLFFKDEESTKDPKPGVILGGFVNFEETVNINGYIHAPTVILHELGHCLYLGHTIDKPNIRVSDRKLMNINYIFGYVSSHSGDPISGVSPDKGAAAGMKLLYPLASSGCTRTQLVLTQSGETINLPILHSQLMESIQHQILEPWAKQNYHNKKSPTSYLIEGFYQEEDALLHTLGSDRTLVTELNALSTRHLDIFESQSTSSPIPFSKSCVKDIEKFIDKLSTKSPENLKFQLYLLKQTLPLLENNTLKQFLNSMPLNNKLMNQINSEIGKKSISESQLAENITIQNFPNPSVDKTTLLYKLPEATYLMIRLVDIQGKVLYTIEKGVKGIGNYETELNTSHLPSGVYFCTLETLKNKVVHKITVKH